MPRHKATAAEKTLERDFRIAMVKANTELHPSRADPMRIKQLRASALPFCPAKFFVQTAMHGPLRFMDFNGMFYTSIGTSVHEVFQTFLGMSGKFLANWYCPQCKSTYKLSQKNTCCDAPMRYNEVDIHIEGISGHIDAIFQDSKGRWWILDFKTSALKSLKTKRSAPGAAYILQIETYAYALFKQYGIKVKGVALPFIARDNPKDIEIYVREINTDDFDAIGKRIARDVKRHKIVKAIETEEDALALLKYKKCGNYWCETCRMSRDVKKRAIKMAFKRGVERGHVPINSLIKNMLKGKAPKLRMSSDDAVKENKADKVNSIKNSKFRKL